MTIYPEILATTGIHVLTADPRIPRTDDISNPRSLFTNPFMSVSKVGQSVGDPPNNRR